MLPFFIYCKGSPALRQVDIHLCRPTPGGRSRSVGGFQWLHYERGVLSVAGDG